MRRALESLLLCAALQAPAAALDITAVVPAAVKGAAAADFAFGPFSVKGIAWDNGAVVLPATVYKDKTYQDVKILSKSLYARLESCFRSGCAPSRAAARPKVKVSDFRPLKSAFRVANAEVVFDGELSVTAGVMASSKEPGTFWVSFPGSVSFRDPAFKSAAESAVIAAWAKKPSK